MEAWSGAEDEAASQELTPGPGPSPGGPGQYLGCERDGEGLYQDLGGRGGETASPNCGACQPRTRKDAAGEAVIRQQGALDDG